MSEMYFQTSESTFLVFRVMVWVFHGVSFGWGCSSWVHASETCWQMGRLRTCAASSSTAVIQWLTCTYLSIKIACVLRWTDDSVCSFTSGHFLINGWTVLGLVKAQGAALCPRFCECPRLWEGTLVWGWPLASAPSISSSFWDSSCYRAAFEYRTANSCSKALCEV